ncbi:thioesterase family protein [uncultured Xylophilus sp.]|uniref:acyl-CoA thioesterase n=1 Tax=uncultured Xylophilus sp. TaxID=296832 RepID=UPI0025F5626D|nr:thioesterase family protein [uncultured Xylophilus sp.]
MSLHPFDEALQLAPDGAGRWTGQPSRAYWNMVGPFGGLTAATLLQALMRHPDRLGEPLSLTVNFAGPVADAPFAVEARPVRTNRSTQHWTLALLQPGADGEEEVVTTGTAVTAARRSTWGATDLPAPAAPPPEGVTPRPMPFRSVEWIRRYDMRPLAGGLPDTWDGQGDGSLTRLWLRDAPPRPLDFPALAALCDVFFPRVWLRRATQVPAGTVSLTVYFHAGAADLAATGTGFLLAQAGGQEFRNGFFDQSAQLWNADGLLLATSHQVVYYKQ